MKKGILNKNINIACVLGLYKDGRVKISDKEYKRLNRQFEGLTPLYKEYGTKEILKDSDIVLFDEIDGRD